MRPFVPKRCLLAGPPADSASGHDCLDQGFGVPFSGVPVRHSSWVRHRGCRTQ